ncbi:ABC transporter ATP-binding protein [Actinosynnema sp. NPDC023587]|uniref:ABC transporter ATP-binding protein n=1 Tax=Actinosynnema sp. NPDC023587 TaxID=3154695 RepID=UPI0033EBAB59
MTSTVTGRGVLGEGARHVRGGIWGAFAALAVSLACDLAGPLLVRAYVDDATGATTTGALVGYALGYFGVAAVGVLAGLLTSYLSTNAGWGIADAIRSRVFRHVVTRRPVLAVESRPQGETLEEVEGNADIIGEAIAEAGFRVVGNIALAVGTLVIMFTVVPQAGLGITLLVVVVAFALVKLTNLAVERWERARERKARIFGFVGDAVAARDDLLPLGASGWPARRLHGDLRELLTAERRAYVGGRAFWPLTQLFFALSFGIGFGVGLQLLGQGGITIGTLTMIYLYVDRLREPLEDMSSQVDLVQRLLAALNLAARSLTGGAEPEGARRPLPAGPLDVRFADVGFAYPGSDARVLHGVDLVVPAGSALGVVGRTGAGKSTVLNLLCGLARPDQGRVLIGGVDAADVDPVSFAARVSVLSQRAHLFAATVRENVTFFDDTVPDAEVHRVLDELGAGWVRDLPDGLDTVVGTGGRALSEGEAQVLAGARVMLRHSDLLIVDEGTSRLDPETERGWTALLGRLAEDRTVVMVAHRAATLSAMDAVAVVVDGRVDDVLRGADITALAEKPEELSR